MAKKQPMVITISGDRSIHQVASDLEAAGFDVEQILESVNVVTGSGHANAKEHLRSISGVVDVSDDHPVDIGPPDASIS